MGAGKSKVKPGIELNLKTPAENAADSGLVGELSGIVGNFQQILTSFQNYEGSGQLIRTAIGTPNAETEAAAWNVVRVGVGQLRDFFEMGGQLEACLPKIYAALGADADADDALRNHQQITRILCDVLDFATRFDDMKMVNPAVQNDLAYYRRVLSRLKREKKTSDGEIKDEIVDRMSLFYAHASPMTRIVIDTTVSYISSCDPINAAKGNKVLARLTEMCKFMLQSGKVTDSDTQQLYLRTMTACLLVLDHTNESGVFVKKSPVDIVGCIKLLQSWKDHNVDSLMNSLRFMTVHSREPNVQAFVKKSLW